MNLALFDLDNTLIAGDSDTLWGKFLVEHGHIDAEEYLAKHQRYYDDYVAGRLDIYEFLAFQLHILSQHDLATLQSWRAQFIEEKIREIILPKAQALIQHHREQGHTLVIITATNRFITEPIAEMFGVVQLIATEPERINGRYTGKVSGTPSFAAGKVERLEEWLQDQPESLCESWFYSDSHNDIPLLNQVCNPVAVDPDEKLAAAARKQEWPIISLR